MRKLALVLKVLYFVLLNGIVVVNCWDYYQRHPGVLDGWMFVVNVLLISAVVMMDITLWLPKEP